MAGSPQWFDPTSERQRATADALRQQSMQPVQGQMVSGRYVQPSWTEGLARMFQGYASGRLGNIANERERTQRSELADALRGPKAEPDSLPARLGGLRDNPQAQQLAMQLALRRAESEGKQFQMLAPEQAKAMGLGPGQWGMDPSGKPVQVYKPEQPDFNKMIVPGPDGQPMVNPMYVQAKEQIARAGKPDASSVKVDVKTGPQVGTIPQGWQLEYNDQGQPVSMSPIPGGPAEQEITKEGQQADMRRAQVERYADVVTQDIDRALGIVDQANVPVTGFGSYLAAIPGTPARDLAGLVDTIRANVGFDRLQQMREASPTGGALGQVSNLENRLLQATLGNLEQSQSEDQFKFNLQRVKDIYSRIINQGIPAEEAEALISEVGSEGVPEGVDPADWKFMTPEERALFQ